MGFRGKRLVLGKLGLDAHDNGLQIISRWLMESGYEVIYAGLYNSTKDIAGIALQESADLIGISFLCGGHLSYTADLAKELKHNDMDGTKIVVGGVIPPDDVSKLEALGADAVLTPGTSKQEILDTIQMVLS